LNAIVLATDEGDAFGWHNNGVVAICAWTRALWMEHADWFVNEHRPVYERLGIPMTQIDSESYRVEYTEKTAKAFQLLHIFLHELGHHHDRMTTRSKARSARGESYAEQYALNYESLIFDRYQEVFGPLG
jgi:hypothetical protein